MGRLGVGAYFKAAFQNRWNLLLFGGGVLAALLSGHADVALPLVAAAELAAVVGMASHPTYQRAVDIRAQAAEAAATQQSVSLSFDRLYGGLEAGARDDFDRLRARCETLGEMAGAGALARVAEDQAAAIDRLLWVYLKLLHTRQSLWRFLETTDERELELQYAEAFRRLDGMPKESADPLAQRKRRALEDTLQALDARRKNLKRARDNYEYVHIELGRIAAKLTGIAELAANRQDPSFLTREVDEVAESVQATEQAIGELQSLTGLGAEDVEAPRILNEARRRAAAAAQQTGR